MESEHQPNRGLKRIWNALFYSKQGLTACYHHEEAFRQELLACLPLFPLALWLGQTPVEQALLAGVLLLVLIIELLNSAVEAVVDRIGSEHHELSGRAKDIGSAAVLLGLLLAGLVWGLILLPRWP